MNFTPAGAKPIDFTSALGFKFPVETLMMGTHCVIKEFVMPAGSSLKQHKHQYPHASALVSGTVRLTRDGHTAQVVSGPVGLIIPAHSVHFLDALTDAVWLCIHPDNDQVDWIET